MAFIISFCAMSIMAILIPLYFVYQDNKRKAAAGKKDSLQRKAERYNFIIKTIYGQQRSG